jgi:hypothetical protein
MDKNEFQQVVNLIDCRLDLMGAEEAAKMVRVFELLSASFAKEPNRPSVLVHGAGENNLVVVSINSDPVAMVSMLAAAYTQMHDTFLGEAPDKGMLN